MVLEKTKFLEEAISTMYEEVMEELESIKEGAHPENAHVTIAKIVQDLYDTSKNLDSLGLKDKKHSEPFRFQFSITSIVDILEPIYVDLSENEWEVIPPPSELNFDKSAVVVERKLAYGYEPFYTIEQDGRKFTVSESFLLPADNHEYEFSIGDEVIISKPGHCFGGYKRFAEHHGHPDAIGSAHGISDMQYQPMEYEIGIILARGKHLDREDQIIYVVQVSDKKYLMRYDGIVKK